MSKSRGKPYNKYISFTLDCMNNNLYASYATYQMMWMFFFILFDIQIIVLSLLRQPITPTYQKTILLKHSASFFCFHVTLLHSYTLTFIHSYTLTLWHSYTLLQSYILTLLHSYTLTFIHSYTLTLLHSYTLSLFYNLIFKHSYTLTFLHSYALIFFEIWKIVTNNQPINNFLTM